ncbi:MAG: hypothetical protein ACXADY_06300 [Candidatus Hodarchaeales archaeon]|jgi:hypothetical protein
MVSSELKKSKEDENSTCSLDRKNMQLFRIIKKKIRSNYLIIICLGIGILISLVRMLVDGIGYSHDEYDLYAEYFKGMFRNNLTFEQESWFEGYRLKNRMLYPFILSITSLITTIEPIIVAIPLGIVFFLLSILVIVQILRERGNSPKEINIIVSLFAVAPGLVPHMVRPTTDHLFMFLVLVVLLFFIKYVKRKNYLDLIFSIFSLLLAIITREFAFILIFILPIFYIVKWVEVKKYQLISGYGMFTVIIIIIFLQILNFTPLFTLRLFFSGYAEKILEIIKSGNISFDDISYILHKMFIEKWTTKGFIRVYTVLESLVYTILLASILSFFGFFSWDKEKKFQEIINLKRSVLVIWFILGISSLIILQRGSLQARYWMPIMIIPYLEIPSGISYFKNKFGEKISENWILSLIITFQITISIIRIICAYMNIGLVDIILVFS